MYTDMQLDIKKNILLFWRNYMNKKAIVLISVYFLCFFCFIFLVQASNENKNEILATVNGENITKQDYFQSMGNMPNGMKEKYEEPKQIKMYLNKAIEQKLLLKEGLKLGIDKDPLIVKRLNDLRQRLVVDALYKRIIAGELTDERLERYYRENIGKYTKETVRASHILVKTETEARNVLKKLNEGGSFETLAGEHSLDPTKEKGGDLGFIPKGKMAPEFDKALFELKKVGDISPIVKTRFGYHIIKLTRALQKNTDPFEKVKNMIRRDLERELLKNYISKLKSQAKITVTEKYK